MAENIIKNKSYAFAIRIVNLYKYLTKEGKEYILAKQILRSGTAIGALITEAEHAESKADFVHKLAIAQKECNETKYWLNLLHDTDYIGLEMFNSLNTDCIEVLKLLTSIIKTTKKNINN